MHLLLASFLFYQLQPIVTIAVFSCVIIFYFSYLWFNTGRQNSNQFFNKQRVRLVKVYVY